MACLEAWRDIDFSTRFRCSSADHWSGATRLSKTLPGQKF
jgi:hypothetical protein